MRRWTIEVTERELRAILSAFDLARDQVQSASWRWWTETKYVDALYHRLRELGLVASGGLVSSGREGSDAA